VKGKRDVFLFDLDGTLIDSIGLIEASYRHTLAFHGYPEQSREQWLEGLGRPLSVQFARLGAHGDEIDAMVSTYRTWNLERHDELVRPFPGIHEALDSLRAGGARLGIVTSKHSVGVQRGLAHCGLEGRFEVVVCSDHVARPKPDAEPVLIALRGLESKPERAIFVGDSPHDLASGRAAGTLTAAVAWGPLSRTELERHKPDIWLARVADLMELPSARTVSER
jgi:pyrophosphatase PpaX